MTASATSFDRCATCGQFDFLRRHLCPPTWEALIQGYDFDGPEPSTEDEADARIVYARTAEEAAEKCAERWDADGCDYIVVGGTTVGIFVRPRGSRDPWTCYDVSGESVPTYHAYERRSS